MFLKVSFKLEAIKRGKVSHKFLFFSGNIPATVMFAELTGRYHSESDQINTFFHK